MVAAPLQLHFREYGQPRAGRPSLLLLHGLFGSSANWGGIARSLADDFHLIVPDLRNHGRSPHAAVMDYPAMAADLRRLLDDQALEAALPVGHSMGGKAAMQLALETPERVAGLVIVDIAPVGYAHGFGYLLDALESLPLARIERRDQADRLLADRLPEPGLRQYLLQNLVKRPDGWQWRIDLALLRAAMPQITGFPEHDGGYPGPALFLHGSESDYLRPSHQTTIDRLFPHRRMRRISGAGHWLYAEQPQAFIAALRAFLGSGPAG